jgi:hypothetical protein
MKPKNILNSAGLYSLIDLKAANRQRLIALVLSGHYLAGMAAKELSGRLCSN